MSDLDTELPSEAGDSFTFPEEVPEGPPGLPEGVEKRVVRAGDGPRVCNGDEVTLNLVSTVPVESRERSAKALFSGCVCEIAQVEDTGQLLHSSLDRGEPEVFEVVEGFDALMTLLQHMRVGEATEFKLPGSLVQTAVAEVDPGARVKSPFLQSALSALGK